MAEGVDLSAIVSEFQRNAKATEELGPIIQQIYEANSANVAAQAELQAQSGSTVTGKFETPTSAAVRLEADLDAQRKRSRIAQDMDYSALSFEIAKQTATTSREAIALADQIAKDKSVSLFEDPLQAIANAFTLPWDEQKLEGTTEKLKLLNDTKAQLDTRMQQAAVTTEAYKESLSAAGQASVLTALEADIKRKRIDLINNANLLQAQGMEAAIKATGQAAEMRFKAYQAEATAEQRQYMREQAAAVREERLRNLKDKEDVRKSAVQYVNAARQRDGLPALDENSIVYGLQSKGPGGEQFQKWFDRGLMIQSGMIPSDGETVQERLEYWKSTGVRPMNEKQGIIMSTVAAADSTAAQTNKDKASRAAEAEKIFNTKFKSWTANIVPGDSSNPFQPPSYEALKGMPEITGHKAWPIVATIVNDQTKNLPVNQQQVFDTLTAAVIAGDIKPADAADFISKTYKKLVDTTNQDTQVYKLTGKHLKEWNATIKSAHFPGVAGTIMNRTNSVNLTDPTKVQKEISRAVVTRLGLRLNVGGAYPPDSTEFYPPILQSGVVGQ